MKANFINSTSYFEALKEIIGRINDRTVDIGVRHLLIVPERYTLLAEKYLYENSFGSFDVEVLSPSRLFYRMGIDTPLLSREGAIMLIRGMLTSLPLSCFFRSASYRGFCEKLYDAINDFAANGVNPDDIPETSPKLCDLKAVYAEYRRRIEGRFVDSMGKLALIAKYATTSSYLDNVHIYVANFDYVDKATRSVFDALKKRAISYTECEVSGNSPVKGKAIKYRGEGALAVKEVAKQLRYAAYNGVPYEDMAVITGNVDCARVKRIFTEFDIPCFITESKRLNDYALSVFLQRLFECAMRKRRDSFIELSKNLYSCIDKKSADEFENYVSSHLIDYKGFYNEFVDCTKECEEVRKKLVSIVEITEKKMKQVTDAKSFGALIEDVFIAAGVEKTTEEVYGSAAPIEKTRALIALMEQVGIIGNFEFVSAVFAEGLKATKMSSIPYAGGVIVGDPASFRGGKYKLMAVLGFDDGFLPQIYDDSSLISDDEKVFFDQMERADQINVRYERELEAALASADNIFITYSEPSGMMESLFGNAPDVDNDELVDAGSKKHALELMMSLVRRTENMSEDNHRLINALHEATEAGDELFMSLRVSEINGGEKLFFGSGTTNVSQLQSYFKCPFKHFAEYGLKLKERDKGEMNALDIGSFMHVIVEKMVQSGDFSDIESSVGKIVDGIIAGGGKVALEANRGMLELLKQEAIAAFKIYASHLAKSSFKMIGQEIKFETKLVGIKLVGKIDMADEFDGYIRLIDYKTGGHEISCSDVYYGKKIQLPLYMAAAANNGYKKAAMFTFPFEYKWLTERFDHRFDGFMLKDEAIMSAVDSSCGDGDSEVFNLKTVGRNDALLSPEEMDCFIDYAVKVSENAITEIKGGYVLPSPCGIKECGYCEYGCLCADKTVRKTIRIYKSNIVGAARNGN
ncbi:MAG: PD-(D/E)XK nuclease family protein [Clostridiales bacterium]|nr:PD-(D/E)XK nuclease family protein [Clostridiales bacterium]